MGLVPDSLKGVKGAKNPKLGGGGGGGGGVKEG